MHVLIMLVEPDVPSGAFLDALRGIGCDVSVPSTLEEALTLSAGAAQRGLALIGVGNRCAWAMLLAARYPVEKLVLIGCPARVRLGVRACPGMRRAMRRLFAIVADLLIIQPGLDSDVRTGAAQAVLRGVSSQRAEARILPGASFPDLWTNCKHALIEAVLHFLAAPSPSNSLAK